MSNCEVYWLYWKEKCGDSDQEKLGNWEAKENIEKRQERYEQVMKSLKESLKWDRKELKNQDNRQGIKESNE
jgi:hypothetical protein